MGFAPTHNGFVLRLAITVLLLEAASGFEPLDNGFADRRLATWLCRQSFAWLAQDPRRIPSKVEAQTVALLLGYRAKILFTSPTISSMDARHPTPVLPQASLPLIGSINL